MSKETPIQDTEDKITKIIGFAGLLLGILANTISTIKFDEFNGLELLIIKVSLLVSTLGLVMSLVCGSVAFIRMQSTEIKYYNPTKLLASSYIWLTIGISMITGSISIIITKSVYWSIVFLFIVLLALFYELHNIKKNETIQTSKIEDY